MDSELQKSWRFQDLGRVGEGEGLMGIRELEMSDLGTREMLRLT